MCNKIYLDCSETGCDNCSIQSTCFSVNNKYSSKIIDMNNLCGHTKLEILKELVAILQTKEEMICNLYEDTCEI